MTKMTNHAAGPRGITMQDGSTVWLNPGESADIDKAKVGGELPDLGTAPTTSDADDADLIASVEAENADLKKQIADLSKENADLKRAAGPDYERDSLKDVDLHKPATSKDVLLVIAAYEQAEVPEGDDATKADLIKAIEAKRKA